MEAPMPIIDNRNIEKLELPGLVHQFVNTSSEEMRLVAALGMASVRVRTAEGDPLPLPWDAPSA